MPDAPAPVLDREQAEFICSAISMSAACGRPGGLPSLARATGCRVSPDGHTVTLLLAATPAAGLLDDLRRSGKIAVVFSRPADHRTLQLKGSDALIVPLEAGDAERASAYADAFAAGLDRLGYPGAVIRSLLASTPEDLVAVSFTPTASFSQTPGPEAGTALRSGA